MENRDNWGRRSVLKMLGVSAAAGWMHLPASLAGEEPKKVWLPRFWDEKVRPRWVWENHEDMMYHDLSIPDPELMSAPEFHSFMGQVWVFNKAMEWHRANLEGCIVCYSSGGDLALTGEHQVSQWHSDPRNVLESPGEFTRFEKKSGRRRDCAVLPAFQFHLGQHPKIELEVSQASSDWQFCISIKGRSGPPLLSTGWHSGAATAMLDPAAELARRGYRLNFTELHCVMGTWTNDAGEPSSVSYKVRLPGQAAVVTCLPVIRSASTASAAGVPIVGVALDARGQRLGASQVALRVALGGRSLEMQESDGFWKATVRDLEPGDYDATVIAEGAVRSQSTFHVRVTDGQFFSYDPERRLMTHGGKPVGPMTGSYQGTFFFRDVGGSSERLVNSQAEWDAWDRSRAPGEHLHYWESLTEKELDERFAYLQRFGWDILHLHQHWGVWERLDGGGRIAPHGAEQVALYMRTAARHGLALIQALSSYEYAVHRDAKLTGGTAPWSVYVDAGFKDKDWFKPEGTTFQRMFRQYLSDYISLFKEETALFGMTPSGEGDHENGPAFTNDVFRFVRSLDPNHFFPAETLFGYPKLPSTVSQDFEEDLFGERTYFIADKFLPEFDLGVLFKFLQTGKNYLAEGSWPTPNIYTAYHYEWLKNDHKDPGPESWVGTLRYRTRLRDTYYLGLVHRMPILDTWDEAIAEDEHIVFRQIREEVDWRQPFLAPPVALRVDDWSNGEGRAGMIRYETFFSDLPVACGYILADATAPEGALVIDARQPYQEPRLPGPLRAFLPLTLSPGYSSNYLLSEDHRTLLAYVYNTTNHIERPQWICGRYHRIPSHARLSVGLRKLAAARLNYKLYDLNTKQVVRQGTLTKESSRISINLGSTDHDYFILTTPALES